VHRTQDAEPFSNSAPTLIDQPVRSAAALNAPTKLFRGEFHAGCRDGRARPRLFRSVGGLRLRLRSAV